MQLMRALGYVLALLLLAACSRDQDRSTTHLLHEENSLYQYIAVIEDPEKGERYLSHRRQEFIQGGIDLAAPDTLLFEYTGMAFIALAFLDRPPRDALFVGLGAGSMPRYLHRTFPETAIEVVEIDPAVLRLAGRFFSFVEERNLRVRIADGRMHLKRNPARYDLIFLDAYQGDTIPFHLTTREFLRETKARLREGGAVAANILAPFRNRFFSAMLKTYQAEFPQVYVFKGERSANYIFIATLGEKRLDQDAMLARVEELSDRLRLDIDLAGVVLKYEPEEEIPASAELLTDDFAPVNLYREQEAP
jgi:spermidine synthase